MPATIIKTPIRIGHSEFADYSVDVTYTSTDTPTTIEAAIVDLSGFAFVDYTLTSTDAQVTVYVNLTDSLEYPTMYEQDWITTLVGQERYNYFQVWTRWMIFSAYSEVPGSPGVLRIKCRLMRG